MSTDKKPVIIALVGKGGVGKTSISAVVTKILSEKKDAKVLAIDADPAVGLATALGVKVSKTVNDIREDAIESAKAKELKDKETMLSNLEYEVFDAIVEKDNLAFLAIGRPEDDGCFCRVNSLLKDIIASLADNFDYIVIDGEAGIEQVNRRVMETVTHLLLISDASAKGINVINTINEVAKDLVKYEKSGLILNRLRSEDEVEKIKSTNKVPVVGFVLENDELRDIDIAGGSILELSDDNVINSVKSALEKLGIE